MAQQENELTGDIIVNSLSDINNDELIIEQERQIEKDIVNNNPCVGQLVNVTNLKNDYADDDFVYQQKVEDLQRNYEFIRKTRPDGNCFFRAFGFSYFEGLINDKEEFNRILPIAEKSLDELVKLGFPHFTTEDFYDTFLSILKRTQDGITSDILLEIFNDSGASDYLVVYLRLITSGHLIKECEFFQNFIEGGRTVQEFCKQEVEPMYKESDHIHIIALTSAFNVGVRIIYMDRGEGGKVNSHDFGTNEGVDPRIHLLYRPGHYDILYTKNS